jgi:hypothetical protein
MAINLFGEDENMHSVHETLRLIKRSAEIGHAVNRRGLLHIDEEQELLSIQHRLQRFPAAVAAIDSAASALRRAADHLTIDDVMNLESPH